MIEKNHFSVLNNQATIFQDDVFDFRLIDFLN
jgi:hypothetical protein